MKDPSSLFIKFPQLPSPGAYAYIFIYTHLYIYIYMVEKDTNEKFPVHAINSNEILI